MNKKVIPALIIVAIAALVTVSIIARSRKSYIEVETVDVALGDFSKEVSANGEIRTVKDSVAVAKVNGNIRRLHVKEGDRVNKGDVLVSLDRKDLDSQVRNASSSVDNTKMSVRRELLSLRTGYTQAVSSYDKAKRDFERTAELQKIGSASDEELRVKQDIFSVAEETLSSSREQLNFREGRSLSDTRETPSPSDDSIVASSSEVKQAESQLGNLTDNLDNYEIRALSSGVATKVNVAEGGVVGIGTLVAVILDDANLEIVTNIDEVDLSWLKTGQTARIESDSFIGEKLEGKIDTIAPVIQKVGDSRVCEITIKITQDAKRLARIGASCSVFIEVEKKQQVPSIPVESYFLKDGKSLAALLVPGDVDGTFKVVLAEVKTGILGVDTVEIVSGLSSGQKIVLKKPSSLSADEIVKLKKVKDAAKDKAGEPAK